MTDWSKFRRHIFIDAPVQTVYDAWAKPGQLTAWYLDGADYFTLNGVKRDSQSPGIFVENFLFLPFRFSPTLANLLF